jgi:hypothetical protein
MGQIGIEQLETMVVDIFDELHRRSVEEEWQASTTAEERKAAIPVFFLPHIDGLPQERQQSRQKLATLGKRQFTLLIRDILAEMDRRRFAGAAVSRPNSRRPSVPAQSDRALSVLGEEEATNMMMSLNEPVREPTKADDEVHQEASVPLIELTSVCATAHPCTHAL